MKEEVYIPDKIFKSKILSDLYIDDDDYIITKDACLKIKGISVYERNIKNLEGIEYFKNLEHLLCYGNKLNFLDVSKNVNLIYLLCSNNQLASLDLNKNTNLEVVSCVNNKLSILDISSNKKLRILYCSSKTIKTVILNNNIIKIDEYKATITNFKELTIVI